MRIAIWMFVVGCAVAAVALFLPLVQMTGGSQLVGKRATVSMVKAARDRELAARFVVAYHASHAREVGPAVIAALTPRVGRRLRGVLGDATDAMDTLDGVNAADAKTLGTVLAATVYSFLALEILAIGLLFGSAIGDRPLRGKRAGPALGLALLLGAAALGIHMVAREVAFQANDYVGAPLIGLAVGAYLLPIGALVAIGAGIALVILLVRRRHDSRVMDPRSGGNAPPVST